MYIRGQGLISYDVTLQSITLLMVYVIRGDPGIPKWPCGKEPLQDKKGGEFPNFLYIPSCVQRRSVCGRCATSACVTDIRPADV